LQSKAGVRQILRFLRAGMLIGMALPRPGWQPVGGSRMHALLTNAAAPNHKCDNVVPSYHRSA